MPDVETLNPTRLRLHAVRANARERNQGRPRARLAKGRHGPRPRSGLRHGLPWRR